MKTACLLVGLALPLSVYADGTVGLPPVTIHSERVANQNSAATFAMPVTALRFEPRVDIQSRNLAEGQADVTLRGGIFENTGLQLGAVTLSDPQTGHYLAELPVAPALLTPPEVTVGPLLALGASNASVGAVHHGWRPVRTGGAAAVAVGDHDLRRAELHQGFVTAPSVGGGRLGVDVALARSESDGSVPFGEHEFERGNVRLQYRTARAQTDLFAGYQGKRFGWPNLYTPFNSSETENLQTTLFVLNHRLESGRDEFFEVGAFHRRNKDDYAFDRFAPLGPVHPFQHTTWLSGVSGSGRHDVGGFAVAWRGEVLTDRITSSSLTFGRYRSRTLSKFAVVPEMTWTSPVGRRTILRGGVAYEDTNRDGGSLAPVFEIAREFASARLRRIAVSYTRTSQMPTYTALNSSPAAGLFRGNPDLGRQKSDNVEIAVAALVGGWETSGAVFWRRDDSLVDWTFARGVTARTAAAVDIGVGGIELVARRTWGSCDLVIGYTGLTKDADYGSAAVDASFYALNYARHRITAATTLRLGHGFEVRMDNVIRFQAPNLLRTVGGDDAITTALGVSYRPIAWPRVEFAVQADNLWDTEFQDVPAVPAARRQVSAGVSYVW